MGKADAEPPQYRACIAAKGCLEAEFLGMVPSKLFDGRHWKCLPAHKRTVDVQHLIFKILSRMGRAAQEHLFLHHEQFPTKLLLILEDTDLGEAFVRTWESKKCMLDVLSAACIGKYKVAGFDDPEAKIVLQQVAQSMRMDIADIESRHASLRRVLKSVVQTHMLNKESSADLWPSGSSVLEVALCIGNKTEEERGIQHQKRRAVRSAWATFISEQSVGKKVDFRELNDKNCNISHEEYQRLQARGSLVAPARGDKRKHRAFVKPLLQARQQAQTKLRTERWRHCQHERSQTRVLDSMLVTARATGGKMVSLP